MNISRFNFNPASFQSDERKVETGKPDKFAHIMKGLGRMASTVGKTFLSMTPAGSIINAAFQAFGKNQSSTFGDYGGLNPYDMLGIQQQMLKEAEIYTLISNIIKLQHDTTMNAIRNIR